MPNYNCPRCGYNSHIKTYLYKHFMRKHKCKPILLDISVEDCFREVLGYEMYHCNRKMIDIVESQHLSQHSQHFEPKKPNLSQHLSQHNQHLSQHSQHLSQHFSNNEILKKPYGVNDNKNKIKTKNFKCKFCNKLYSFKQSLYRHMKTCQVSDVVYDNNIIENDVERKIIEIKEESKKEINELRKQVEDLVLNNFKNHTIQGNAVINNIYNISLNAFGKEETSYISKHFIQQILSIEPLKSVPKLLQEIHFNPRHRENHNIFIQNKKCGLVKVFDGDKWIYTKKKRGNRRYDIQSF